MKPAGRSVSPNNSDPIRMVNEFLEPRHLAIATSKWRVHKDTAIPFLTKTIIFFGENVVSWYPMINPWRTRVKVENKMKRIKYFGRCVPIIGRANGIFMFHLFSLILACCEGNLRRIKSQPKACYCGDGIQPVPYLVLLL